MHTTTGKPESTTRWTISSRYQLLALFSPVSDRSGSGFTISFTNSKPMDLIKRMSSPVIRMMASGGMVRNWRSIQSPRSSASTGSAGRICDATAGGSPAGVRPGNNSASSRKTRMVRHVVHMAITGMNSTASALSSLRMGFKPVRTEWRGKLPIRACPGGSPVCRLTHRRFVGQPAFLWDKPRGDGSFECVW